MASYGIVPIVLAELKKKIYFTKIDKLSEE